MTPIQHLERLYNAVRKLHLPAADHDALRESAEEIARMLGMEKADAPAA
jgi:branched-subunit amino acid aminotransferase/4-amino-4-deoxychorismate lyase